MSTMTLDIKNDEVEKEEDSQGPLSPKVQRVAEKIYKEFERMMTKYDREVVKDLVPLTVNILEDLDASQAEIQDSQMEAELLREDNRHLAVQYEKERQLRQNSEQKLLELEYRDEESRKSLRSRVESLEALVQGLELKVKNAQDHAAMMDEKETLMSEEYLSLHSKYTQLLEAKDNTRLTRDEPELNLTEKVEKSTLLVTPYKVVTDWDSAEEEQSLADTFEARPFESLEHSEITDWDPNLSSVKTKTRISRITNFEADFDDYGSYNQSTPYHPGNSTIYRDSSTPKQINDAAYQEISFDDENSESLAKELESEVGILIRENNDLMATKHALNIVKDDLIARVDEMTIENRVDKKAIQWLSTQKEDLTEKIKEMEADIKQTREEAESYKRTSESQQEHLSSELNRILKERNQYKVMLMELQECVHWADRFRASKSIRPAKKTSSFLNYFNRLFRSSPKEVDVIVPELDLTKPPSTHTAEQLLYSEIGYLGRLKNLGDSTGL